MAKESKIKTNLKEVREAYGMTQQDLADQVGIRRETIVGNGFKNSASL